MKRNEVKKKLLKYLPTFGLKKGFQNFTKWVKMSRVEYSIGGSSEHMGNWCLWVQSTVQLHRGQPSTPFDWLTHWLLFYLHFLVFSPFFYRLSRVNITTVHVSVVWVMDPQNTLMYFQIATRTYVIFLLSNYYCNFNILSFYVCHALHICFITLYIKKIMLLGHKIIV